MSTTAEDVRRAFASLQHAWKRNGITREGPGGVTLTGDELVLEEGSPTYGRAWRLYYRMPETFGLYTATSELAMGYLGSTRREAEQSLRMLAAGIGIMEQRDL